MKSTVVSNEWICLKCGKKSCESRVFLDCGEDGEAREVSFLGTDDLGFKSCSGCGGQLIRNAVGRGGMGGLWVTFRTDVTGCLVLLYDAEEEVV